ncbi:hypothetical protein PanWU01x14_061510 [Parasponia andersonii]|uniref:Uncharacterized protein n=1 Tax=Parasponia andersonii TaxID=3476 RepID=A0A2P5DI89_PARAD|nr:hypothetical protein PanWU01x14_061510 [Parasponia andersonii]
MKGSVSQLVVEGCPYSCSEKAKDREGKFLSDPFASPTSKRNFEVKSKMEMVCFSRKVHVLFISSSSR